MKVAIMQYTTLGRAGLKVSVAGLGTGGFSRLGLANGGTEAAAIAVVRAAHDLGVTLFDTGTNYRNADVLGRALAPIKRDAIVITTKSPIHNGKENRPVAEIVGMLDATLRDLQTDYVDVFQLHGPPPAFHGFAADEVIPAMLKEKAKGKFRFLGISETAPGDVEHTVLCAPRTWCGHRAVRHRQQGASGREHFVHSQTTVAGGGPGEDRCAVRASGGGRAGPAAACAATRDVTRDHDRDRILTDFPYCDQLSRSGRISPLSVSRPAHKLARERAARMRAGRERRKRQ